MEKNQNYVLITGASSGIGYELAKLFAEKKYNLILVGRNIQTLSAKEHELKQHGVNVISIARDLFNTEEAFSLYEEVKAQGLKVEILVNDAGQGVYGEFEDTDIDRELNIIDLNISSLIILTKSFLKDMINEGNGKILNVASIASKVPGPWQSVYHGTKAFVLSFSEAIREETKDKGITVTALMPGATDTDFFNKADMLSSKAVQDKEALSDPSDVAKDGFDALFAGKDKVVSGLKNKIQVQISNVTPDEMVAHQMYEQQKPIDSK